MHHKTSFAAKVGLLLAIAVVGVVPLSRASADEVTHKQSGSARVIDCQGYANHDTGITWTTNQSFTNGSWCATDNVDTTLNYQSDGNLVWYVNDQPVWYSGTAGRGAQLVFQGDGNIVIYSSANAPIWAAGWIFNDFTFHSDTSIRNWLSLNTEATYFTGLNGHRNISLSSEAANSHHPYYWQYEGTSDGSCMQTSFAWNIDRSFTPGSFCVVSGSNKFVFQSDGNLVRYSNNIAQWNSGTSGRGAKIAFQSDGNVVIYNASNAPIWAYSWQTNVPLVGTIPFVSHNIFAGTGVYSSNDLLISFDLSGRIIIPYYKNGGGIDYTPTF